ncbi:unnamed protein product [Rotaria sp. Silwood2]|nr:unnamed protein product [Rotaria sp. Silwood2]
MDLVFLVFERQKYRSIVANQFEFDVARFSENFHNLLTLVDVINALTDKTKQSTFSDKFILQSSVLLGINNQFNQDDTEQSNTSFNTIADWQLIHFMNNHPLIDISLVQFINDLPAESVSNPIYYKAYSSLSDIPAISIRIRAKVLYPFNLLLENLVSMIDCSLLPRQSVLIDKILAGRIYMLYPMKFRLFNETSANTEIMSSVDVPTINFDPVQANSTSPHGQYTMFHQAYKQLHSLVHELSRSKYDRLWLAQYLGMYSIDQDGPYRDSISCICDDICSTRLPLFILCPNRRTKSGRNRYSSL